jgi:hypothetical protein
VLPVSLNAKDRQALESIEARLAGSDPKLASMLDAFTRLTVGEEMPGPERIHRGSAHSMRIWRTLRLPRIRLLGWSRWPRAWLLLWLWLAVSLALITVAVVLSRGHPGTCAGPRPECPGHAAHTEAVSSAVPRSGYGGFRNRSAELVADRASGMSGTAACQSDDLDSGLQ